MSDYIYTPEPSGEPEREATPAPGYRLENGLIWYMPTVEQGGAEYVIGNSIEELNRLWALLATARTNADHLANEVARLKTEQIHGDDPRLSDFWAKAQELADRGNHCEVFDEIAEALGGPTRYHEYDCEVTVPVSGYTTITVSVEARDEDSASEMAIEEARQMVRNGYRDIEDNLDDLECDWSSAEVGSIEEV
jgi:hypothetical protein